MKKYLLALFTILLSFSSFAQVTTSTVLNGSLSADPDGSIVSYVWRQVSGPNTSVITVITAPLYSANASNLIQGVYVFELTVTDNSGSSDRDSVTITVNKGNVIPKADAGPDRSIRLPATSLRLNGSGIGTNVAWKQISGPKPTAIADPTKWQTDISGLTTKGVYSYLLKVDEVSDRVNVIVQKKSLTS